MLENSENRSEARPEARRRCVAPPPAASRDQFPTTEWKWIRLASTEKRQEALDVLCQAYWYPVYCFLRRCGASESDAGDVTQGFFEHLITRNALAKVEPREDSRFRCWLRTQANRYFKNLLRHAKTAKVGGKFPHVSIDAGTAERKLHGELMHELTPERLFDRCWARTVTERAYRNVQERYLEPADMELLEEAMAECSGTAEPRSRPSDPTRTPVPGSERTRKSRRKAELLGAYKKCLRREIHGTLGSPSLIDDEIRVLLDVLPPRKPA